MKNAPTKTDVVDKSLTIDSKSYELEEFEKDSQSSTSSSSSSLILLLNNDTDSRTLLGKNPNKDITQSQTNASVSFENLVLASSSGSGNPEITTRQGQNTTKDFIDSFEQKFFAIYNKFDQLLNQQQQQERSSSVSASNRLDELNRQKAEFMDETAKELSKNINFANDSELIRHFKDIFVLIKASSNEKNSESSKLPLYYNNNHILNI